MTTMTTKLIPLASIPSPARAAERAARARYASRVDALIAAAYRIVVAPGCHSGPAYDPPIVGWVCTRAAADALAARVTRMPDGTEYRRLRAHGPIVDDGGAS